MYEKSADIKNLSSWKSVKSSKVINCVLRRGCRLDVVRLSVLVAGIYVFFAVFDIKLTLPGRATSTSSNDNRQCNCNCHVVKPAVVDPTEEARVLKNQEHRQKRLADACARLNGSLPKVNFTKWQTNRRNVWVLDDRFRYIYCQIAKVGRTSWKRTLLWMTGRMRGNSSANLTRAVVHNPRFADRYLDRHQDFSPDEFYDRIITHFKFMFVRDPFERLVSGYRDYIKRVGYWQQDIARSKKKKVPTARIDRNATFQEFVDWLIDPTTPRPFNEHWLEYYKQCYPCYVHYDFIGKFETLQEDAAYVLRRIGVDVAFPKTDPENTWQKSAEIVVAYRSNVTTDSLKKLRELYSFDYELFDYV